MKRLYLIILMCLSFFVQTFAQEAFYIYRNDGEFNGFFYDQVVSITQSHISLDGTEFEAFVTLEVATADSLYRIPLEYIDSISFVQPEIRLNPRFHRMDLEGMSDYLADKSEDCMTLTFSPLMPDELRPTEGDVLMDCHSDVLEEWFGGKVTATQLVDGYLVVSLEPVKQLGDVFDQLISVEQIVATGDETQPVRRRMAGMKAFNERRKVEGSWTMDAYTFDNDFNLTLDFMQNLSGFLNIHFGFGLNGSIAYNVTSSNFYFSVTMAESVELGVKVGVDYKLFGNDNDVDNLLMRGGVIEKLAKRLAIPFPATCPIAQVNATPWPFLRAEGHIVLSLGGSIGTKKFKQNVTVNNGKLDWSLTDKNASWVEPDWSLTLEANGFAQFGLMLPLKVQTNPMLDNIVQGEVGGTLYVGPKVSGNVTLDIKQLGSIGGVYQSLKSSSMSLATLSVDYKVEAEISSIWGKPSKISREWSHGFQKHTWTVFPDFEQPKYQIDPTDARKVKAEVDVSGHVLFSQTIGLGLYNEKGELVAVKYRDEAYSITNTFNSVEVEFKDLPNGRYQLLPVISKHTIFGDNIPARPGNKDDEVWIDIEGYDIVIDPDRMVVGCLAATHYVGVDTKCTNIEVRSNQKWVTAMYFDGKMTLNVLKYDAKPTDEPRVATITVTGVGMDQRRSASFELVQMPFENVYDYFVVVPDQIDCGAEGVQEKVVKVITSYDDLRVNYDHKLPDWIQVYTAGKNAYVTVSPNKYEDRDGMVVLSVGYSWDHLNDTIRVHQSSLLELIDNTAEFTADGGRKELRVNLQSGGKLRFESDQDWVEAFYMNGKIYVQAERNFTAGYRSALINVFADINGVSARSCIAVRQDCYILLTPSSLTVPAEGGEFDVKVESRIGRPDIMAVNRWIGMGINGSRTLMTIAVEENETGMKREGYAAITARNGNETIQINIPVTQSGDEDVPEEEEELYVSLSQNSADFSSGGGNSSFMAYTNGDRIGISAPGWVQATNKDGYVSFKVHKNNSTTERKGSILVSASRKGQTVFQEFMIVQAGKPKDEPVSFIDYFEDMDFERVMFSLEIDTVYKPGQGMTTALEIAGPHCPAYGTFTHDTNGLNFSSTGEGSDVIYSYDYRTTRDGTQVRYAYGKTEINETWYISVGGPYEVGFNPGGPVSVKYHCERKGYSAAWGPDADGYYVPTGEFEYNSLYVTDLEFDIGRVHWNGNDNGYKKNETWFTSHMWPNHDHDDVTNIKKIYYSLHSKYKTQVLNEETGDYETVWKTSDKVVDHLWSNVPFALCTMRLIPPAEEE